MNYHINFITKAMEETMPAVTQGLNPIESATPVATPKKKSNTGKIIGVIAGVVLLLCATTAFGFYAIYRATQNGPQATAVRNMWEGLDAGDKTLVESSTNEQVFADLYLEDETGVSSADIVKGSNITIVFSSITVENDLAKVFYVLSMDENADTIGAVNYAELAKVGDNWLVTYLGVEEVPVTTSSIDDDLDF